MQWTASKIWNLPSIWVLQGMQVRTNVRNPLFHLFFLQVVLIVINYVTNYVVYYANFIQTLFLHIVWLIDHLGKIYLIFSQLRLCLCLRAEEWNITIDMKCMRRDDDAYASPIITTVAGWKEIYIQLTTTDALWSHRCDEENET